MTDKKWQDIKKVMMRDFKVLDQNLEEEEGGSIQKEILIVQGKKGITKFVRFTRQQIHEDPMQLVSKKDWVLNGSAIVSHLEVFRQDPKTEDWTKLDASKVVK